MYTRVAFLRLHVVCFCLQGEKGEPGFVIAADGSMMSGPAVPVGPKGVKVMFVHAFFFVFCFVLMEVYKSV